MCVSLHAPRAGASVCVCVRASPHTLFSLISRNEKISQCACLCEYVHAESETDSERERGR